MALTSVNLNQVVPQSGSATISIDGGTPVSVSYTKVDNNRFYLHYDASSTPLKGGDRIEVKLPFDIKGTNNQTYSLSTECFVSNIAIADPFTSKGNINRHGDDIALLDIGIYADNLLFTFDTSYPTFTNNDILVNKYYGIFRYFHNTYAVGYFKNEVRRKYYPTKLTFELPEGYLFTDDLSMQYFKLDVPSPVSKLVAPSSVSGSTYVYDLASLFDEAYDGWDPPLLPVSLCYRMIIGVQTYIFQPE